MLEEAKHRSGVRFLCHLRHTKGLIWFRKYISEKNFSKVMLEDYYTQYQLGNKGEWGCWRKSLSEQQGLGYLIVCIAQFKKGATSNAMIWGGYAFAQVGLWLALK